MIFLRRLVPVSAALTLALLPGIAHGRPFQSPSQPIQTQPTQENNPNLDPAPPSKPAPNIPTNAACLSVEQARAQAKDQPLAYKPVCVATHIYDVIELSDGTRFLDVCPATLSDDQCRFTILCPPGDREDVGNLLRFRDQDVRIHGVVRSMNGRMGIVLSHVRQFDGGPEKFRPNPRLLHNFNAQSDRMPIHDPNLSRAGRHRSFMNNNDREALPAKK